MMRKKKKKTTHHTHTKTTVTVKQFTDAHKAWKLNNARILLWLYQWNSKVKSKQKGSLQKLESEGSQDLRSKKGSRVWSAIQSQIRQKIAASIKRFKWSTTEEITSWKEGPLQARYQLNRSYKTSHITSNKRVFQNISILPRLPSFLQLGWTGLRVCTLDIKNTINKGRGRTEWEGLKWKRK